MSPDCVQVLAGNFSLEVEGRFRLGDAEAEAKSVQFGGPECVCVCQMS